MSKMHTLLRARGQLPWLSPIVSVINWEDNVDITKYPGAMQPGGEYDPKTRTYRLAGELTEADVINGALAVMLRHKQRGKGKQVKRWAKGSLQARNTILPSQFHVGTWDNKLGHGKSADEYYDMLPDDPEDEPEDEGEDESGEGEGEEDTAVQAARGKAMSHDSCPPEVKEACRTVATQPLRWQDLLKGAVSRVPIRGASRRCYSKLHRLSACVGGGVILGKLVADRPSCAVVVDTSGSMWDVLDTIKAEVARVVKAVGYDCDIIQCDTAVRGRGKGIAAMQHWHGGGGTTIGPGIKAAEESGAKVIVIITDGYIEGGIKQPKVPVIWCMTTDVRPYGWGTYVKADLSAGK